jgi:hypothetical protein
VKEAPAVSLGESRMMTARALATYFGKRFVQVPSLGGCQYPIGTDALLRTAVVVVVVVSLFVFLEAKSPRECYEQLNYG